MRVLAARGGGPESEFAFGLVRQLFEATVARQARGVGVALRAEGLLTRGDTGISCFTTPHPLSPSVRRAWGRRAG